MQQASKTSSVSDAQSLILMKNMIRISISSICFHRNLFPLSCFRKREYGNPKGLETATSIHTLEPAHENSSGKVDVVNTDAFKLTQWLEQGVFSALEDQYIKKMTFCILTAHPSTGEDVILETYDFHLNYTTVGSNGKKHPVMVNGEKITKQTLKAQANKFVRSLIEFSATLDEVPETRFLQIQLEYQSNCPSDYQPTFFCDANDKSLPLLADNCIRFKIGEINSPHHNMSVEFAGIENLDSLFEFDEPVDFSLARKASSEHDERIMSSTPISYKDDSNIQRGLSTINSEDEGSLTPVSDETDDAFDDSDDNWTIQIVRKYILTNNQAVIRKCANDLHISYFSVKEVFGKLADDGFLEKKGNRFKISIPNSSNGSHHDLKLPPSAPTKVTKNKVRTFEDVEDHLSKNPFGNTQVKRNLTRLSQESSPSDPIEKVSHEPSGLKRPLHLRSKTNSKVVIDDSEEVEWSEEVPLPPRKKRTKKVSIVKDPLYLSGNYNKFRENHDEMLLSRVDYSYSQ